MRRDIDVEPGQIQAGPVVDGHGAEEGAEELDGVAGRAQNEDVADDAGDIGEEQERATYAEAVRDKGDGEETQTAKDVHGYAEVLGLDDGVAHADDDGGQKSAEAVQQDVLAELDGGAEVQLGVLEADADLVPAELVAAHVLGPLDGAHLHHAALVGGEEVGGGRVVGQAEPDDGRDEEGEDALDDVHPAPAGVARHAVHLEDAVGEQAAKGAGHGGAHKQVRHAGGLLVALVHHGEVEVERGEQAGLAGAQDQAHGVQAPDVGDEAREDGGQRPHDAQRRQQDPRRHPLHHDGPGRLKRHVGRVEDGHGRRELLRRRANVLGHARHLDVADVGAVQEARQVHHHDDGHKEGVQLEEELALVARVNRLELHCYCWPNDVLRLRFCRYSAFFGASHRRRRRIHAWGFLLFFFLFEPV